MEAIHPYIGYPSKWQSWDPPPIFNCPSDRGVVQAGLRASYNINSFRTYNDDNVLGFYGIGDCGHGNHTKDSRVPDPSGTIILVDGRTNIYGWRHFENCFVRYPADIIPKHNGGNNYLFCDGHVAWLKYSETVGTGTTSKYHAKGMWTKTAGD